MTADRIVSPASDDPLAYLEQSQKALSDAVARKDLADKLDEFGAKWEVNKAVLANLEALAAHGHDLRGAGSVAVGEARDAVSKIAEFGGDMEKAGSREALVSLIGDFEEWLRGPNGRLTRLVRQAYDDLVKSEFEPLEAAGGVLVQIDAVTDLGNALKTLVARARSISSKPLTELLPSIAGLRAEASVLKAEYEAISHADGAKEFLDALIDGKATLAHVTPAVLDWLDTLNGARQGFRIVSA
jgi:hypothetical protein